MILSFAKPKKVMSSEDYASISADSAPPGVYSGNMSQADLLRWKAKLVGSRSGNHQIEIRTTEPAANLVVIVNGAMPNVEKRKTWLQRETEPFSIKLSANGPTFYDPNLWGRLMEAVREARQVLDLLDTEDTRKAALKTIRAGEHPLERASWAPTGSSAARTCTDRPLGPPLGPRSIASLNP